MMVGALIIAQCSGRAQHLEEIDAGARGRCNPCGKIRDDLGVRLVASELGEGLRGLRHSTATLLSCVPLKNLLGLRYALQVGCTA